MRIYFSKYYKIFNVCNLIHAYCFRFHFLLVTGIISAQMVFVAISTFVNQKKDGSMFGTKHSLMAIQERKTAVFHSFHMSLKLPNLITPGKTPRLLVSSALCQGSIVSLTIYLWLKHVISAALLMFLRTLGRKLFPVTMLQSASSSRDFVVEDTTQLDVQTSYFGVLSCNNFMMTTVFLMTRFVRWLFLKSFCISQGDQETRAIEANT